MSEILTVEYFLSELPSAQHRAGLAGLVLMVRWLKRLGHEGICEIEPVSAEGATLRVDRQGLTALLAELYAGEQAEVTLKKEKEKTVKKNRKEEKIKIPPLRCETDDSGKTVYIYETFIPKSSQVADCDPSKDKLWLKLWRDFLWALLKQPASRYVFESPEPNDEYRQKRRIRADNSRKKANQEAWEQLTGQRIVVDLAGTDFLGAQEKNAEIVPFKDRGKIQFLLNFWPYAVQIYEPVYRNFKGNLNPGGYAIVIPDVADLECFCEEFPEALRRRDFSAHPYFKKRPKQAILNLAPAAGLDFLKCLRDRLVELEGKRDVADLVFAVEVCLLSVSDDGQKNEIRDLVRLTPKEAQINAFSRIQGNLWDTVFTAQRLKNILKGEKCPWYSGFDRLCASLDIAKIFGVQSYFCRDARKSFEIEVIDLNKKLEQAQPASLEKLIYDMVRAYIHQRLAEKYDLEWAKIKGDRKKESDYNEKKDKIIKEAFYGFRSRTGTDFANYFALTLASVNQGHVLTSQNFETLAQMLYKDTDQVKSLTLLALSANSYPNTTQENQKETN